MKSYLEKTIFKDFRKELEGRYGADKAAKERLQRKKKASLRKRQSEP